jgi:hypothetical protein
MKRKRVQSKGYEVWDKSASLIILLSKSSIVYVLTQKQTKTKTKTKERRKRKKLDTVFIHAGPNQR